MTKTSIESEAVSQLGSLPKGQDVAVEADEEDMQSRVRKIIEACLERVARKSKAAIASRDENKEPNLWLRRVKWVEHLESYDPDRYAGIH